jgi:uncharacterized protein DUF6891
MVFAMDAITELQEVISIDIRAGYDEREQIIESAVDFLLGDYNPEWLEDEATLLTDGFLARHMAEQKTWTYETDCDRLDEAFSELDRHGIVARQNFTCCQTCGHTEINTEIAKTQQHRPVRGYVFFHWQDTESAVRNGYLYLAYGSVSGKEHESEYVAQEVMAALRRAGLEADWNDSVRTRICIRNIEWQRRRI